MQNLKGGSIDYQEDISVFNTLTHLLSLPSSLSFNIYPLYSLTHLKAI